jgi:VanZ family protein
MKRAIIFQILTLLYLGTVAFLCFARFPVMNEVPPVIFNIPMDKIVHFLMFLPFPILAYFSLPIRRKGVVKTLLVLVAIFLVGCLIAWGTERVQGLLPYRYMDAADFKADRYGLGTGTIIAFLIQLLIKHPETDA